MRDFAEELRRANLSTDGIGWTADRVFFMPNVEPSRRESVQQLWDTPAPTSLFRRLKAWFAR